MKPEITEGLGYYEFSWAEQRIKIKASRIHVHRDGRITSEVMITTDAPGYAKNLHPPTIVNLTASRTLKELTNTMAQKFPKADWGVIIDQLAHLVQEYARAGEPVRGLSTEGEIKRPEYLLDPFILKNLPTVIFGERGTIKSTMALLLMVALLLPWHDNPLGFDVPDRSIKSLLLDYESDWTTVNWQLKRLQVGLDLPPIEIDYRHCMLPLVDDVEQIQKYIDKTKAEMLIIDSLGLAAGGDLKEPRTATEFYRAVRELKMTTLSLAHTSKEKERGSKTIFGSVYFENLARQIWEVRAKKEAGSEEVDISLFHRKPAPFQGYHRPIGYKFLYTEDSIRVEREDPKTIAEFLEGMGTQARIRELLAAGAMSSQEIADTLDITPGNTRVALSRLKDKDEITKVGNKWGLRYEE